MPRRWPEATGPIPAVERTRILVVGNPEEAADFADALATLGHEAVVIHSVQAAMSVARQWPPDIVFVDVDASVGDLPRFARGLREILDCATTHVVAITERRTRLDGFSAHVLKPLSLDTAEQLIDSLRRG